MNEQPSVEPKPQVETPVSPETKVPGKKSCPTACLIKRLLVAGVLLLLVGAAAAVSIAMYRLPPTDPLVRAVGSRLPYPVASVNGDWIPFGEYFKESDAMTRYIAESGETGLSDSEMTTEVLDTLINQKIVAQLAKSRDITVSEEKVNEILEMAYGQSASKEEFYVEVEKLFGWDEKTFIERVIHPVVLVTQLEEAVQKDAALQSEARGKIDGALARLDAGEVFADVATEVGDDFTAQYGGDIGYVNVDRSLNEIPLEWIDVIDALEVGTYSGVIELPEAFTIIQLRDYLEGTEDESGQAQLSVIYIQKMTVDQVIQDFKDQSKIKKYIGDEE